MDVFNFSNISAFQPALIFICMFNLGSQCIAATTNNDESQLDNGIVSNVTEIPIEEIVVKNRSLGSFRREIEKSKLNIYDLFNSLNDDDEYDMICKREAWIDTLDERSVTRIKQILCMPNYVRNALSRAAQDQLIGNLTPLAPAEITQKNKIFKEKILELANSSEELKNAIFELEAIVDEYRIANDEKYADD